MSCRARNLSLSAGSDAKAVIARPVGSVERLMGLAGADMAAGDKLLLMWGAANRDPMQFEMPNEFRLDRASGKTHLTFGKGVHFCVGAALARLEAQVALGALLHRTSWIEASEVGAWLPSVLVRRRERLRLFTLP